MNHQELVSFLFNLYGLVRHHKVQQHSIFHHFKEYKAHVGYHPRRNGRHAFCIWRDINDGVENVSGNEKQVDEKTNSAWYLLCRN